MQTVYDRILFCKLFLWQHFFLYGVVNFYGCQMFPPKAAVIFVKGCNKYVVQIRGKENAYLLSNIKRFCNKT